MTKSSEPSRLTRIIRTKREVADDALEDLRAVASLAGIAFPSACVDWYEGRFTGDVLVELGRIRPEVAHELTDLLRDGLKARKRAQS